MTDYTMGDEELSEAESYDEYDLEGFTREEVERYNRMASPASKLKRKARNDLEENEEKREASMVSVSGRLAAMYLLMMAFFQK